MGCGRVDVYSGLHICLNRVVLFGFLMRDKYVAVTGASASGVDVAIGYLWALEDRKIVSDIDFARRSRIDVDSKSSKPSAEFVETFGDDPAFWDILKESAGGNGGYSVAIRAKVTDDSDFDSVLNNVRRRFNGLVVRVYERD